MTSERASRYVPGVGFVAVEAHVHWAPGVEPRLMLTSSVVDQQVEAFVDREVTSAVERFIESLP